MKDSYDFWYPFIRTAFHTVFRLCGGFRAEGEEHVPRTGGVLVAANHISYSDPAALGVALPRKPWFMAKEPLFDRPILGRILRFMRSFPVDQEHLDRQAFRRAHELLGSGELVVIFPEGTTSATGELLPFYPGMAAIAARARVPIVPAALIGTNRVVPHGRAIPRPARGGVTVRFAPPVEVAAAPPELDRRERLDWLTERVREAIAGMLAGGPPG